MNILHPNCVLQRPRSIILGILSCLGSGCYNKLPKPGWLIKVIMHVKALSTVPTKQKPEFVLDISTVKVTKMPTIEISGMMVSGNESMI